MSGEKVDKNMPIGRPRQAGGLLPPPEKPALPEETVKMTMCLSKSSVLFFKQMGAATA